MFDTLQALLLNLPDLIIDEPSALHVATQLSQRVGRDWLALRRAQAVKARGGPFQLRIEAADAEPNQRCLHSVDDPTSLSDEAVMLAVGPLGILVLHCRDLDHLAVITLAAQPAEKGAFEQLGVETVKQTSCSSHRLRPSICWIGRLATMRSKSAIAMRPKSWSTWTSRRYADRGDAFSPECAAIANRPTTAAGASDWHISRRLQYIELHRVNAALNGRLM